MMHVRDNNLKTDVEKLPDEKTLKESPRYYKQQYRKAWEQLPEFNGWLEGVPNNSSRAFCRVCKRNFYAHRLTLLKHTASIKHMKLAQEQFKTKKLEETKSVEKSLKSQKVVSIEVDVSPDEVEIGCSSNENKSNTNDKSNGVELVQSDTPTDLPETVKENDSTSVGNNSDKTTAPVPEPVERSPITTHVLDTAKGLPVPGLPVSIYQLIEGRWSYINEAHTNPDGRCTNLLAKEELKPGRFKLHFDTDKYFELRNNDRLFPFIEIVFDVRSPLDHLHIPLLMSPYGYTTYRGS